MTCRNSQDLIQNAIASIFAQTINPKYVIVVDDGSTDKTSTILASLQVKHRPVLHIISNPDLGHDVTRVVSNWNKALRFAKENDLPETDYHLIATDDLVLEPDYVEELLTKMQATTAVVSGRYDVTSKAVSPRGAGRLVKNSFFNMTRWGGLYPERMGYESAILYEALKLGFTIEVMPTAHYDHVRPLGKNHKFRNFGRSMRTLGYHPLYVWGRFFKSLLFGRGRGLKRIDAFYMMYYYLSYHPKEVGNGFDSYFDPDLRAFIRQVQLDQIQKKIKKSLKLERVINPKYYYKRYTANDIILPLNRDLISQVFSLNPQSVIEFGCGTGKNLDLLRGEQKDVRVFGIDISKNATKIARTKYRLDVVCASEDYLRELPDKSFDVGFTCSVLDHIEEIDNIVTELNRICRMAIVIAETRDIVGKFYYAHDYEKYGFRKKEGYRYESRRPIGNGATYEIWQLNLVQTSMID